MAVERTVSDQGEAFTGELVDYSQHPKPAPIKGFRAHEVHAPLLIRPRRLGCGYARSPRQLLAHLGPHCKPILSVKPIDTFGIHPPAFSPECRCQPPVAETHPARRQLT